MSNTFPPQDGAGCAASWETAVAAIVLSRNCRLFIMLVLILSGSGCGPKQIHQENALLQLLFKRSHQRL
jgi:hypothetical protein